MNKRVGMHLVCYYLLFVYFFVLLHRVVHPRQQGATSENVPFVIMWTSTTETKVTSEWSPSHFVSCYDKQILSSNVSRANISSLMSSGGANVHHPADKDPYVSTSTKSTENKALPSTSADPQLTTAPSPSFEFKSTTMVRALSKVHSKRKSLPERLSELSPNHFFPCYQKPSFEDGLSLMLPISHVSFLQMCP